MALPFALPSILLLDRKLCEIVLSYYTQLGYARSYLCEWTSTLRSISPCLLPLELKSQRHIIDNTHTHTLVHSCNSGVENWEVIPGVSMRLEFNAAGSHWRTYKNEGKGNCGWKLTAKQLLCRAFCKIWFSCLLLRRLNYDYLSRGNWRQADMQCVIAQERKRD